MSHIALLIAAIAPGIALMTYFYLRDRYSAEPIKLIMRLFAFGMLLVFPTMVLQRGLVLGFGEQPWLFAFVVSAGIEEFLKIFLLYHIMFNRSHFDEPYDGIVYAVAVSLGFATVENVLYAWQFQATPATLLFRALLPVSAHALFGVVMGYYLGRAKFVPTRRRFYLTLSYVVPLSWHGVYDYLLLVTESRWFWFMLPFMAVLWGRSLWKVWEANRRSPFKGIVSEEELPSRYSPRA